MSVNVKQFEKNKKWINKQISRQYPGVSVHWSPDMTPKIRMPEKYKTQMQEVIKAVQALYSECGGETEFYPERAETN